MKKVGEYHVVTAEDLSLAGGHLISIDQASTTSGGYLLRISLQFPVPEDSNIPAREYIDSRGVTHRVNAGGFRGALVVGPDFPGTDTLQAKLADGWKGNVGERGTNRLFLVPNGDDAGLVFRVVMRTNPNTGEEVPSLDRPVPVNLRIGQLTAAYTPNQDDLAQAQAILAQAKAAPVKPAAPAKPAAPSKQLASWDGLF